MSWNFAKYLFYQNLYVRGILFTGYDKKCGELFDIERVYFLQKNQLCKLQKCYQG